MTHLLLRLLFCCSAVFGSHWMIACASEPPQPASKQIAPDVLNAADGLRNLVRERTATADANVERAHITLKMRTASTPQVINAVRVALTQLFQTSDDTAPRDAENSIQTVSQENPHEFRVDRGPQRDRGPDRGPERDRLIREEHEERREVRDRDRDRDARPPHRGEGGDDRPHADRPHADRPHHPQDAHERIRALMEAAERLEHGGLQDVANELRHQAERLERELRPEGDHRDEVLRELLHNVHELRREVREVHERLDVVLKQMERSAPEPDPAFRNHDEKRDRGPVRNFENKKPKRDRDDATPSFVRPADQPRVEPERTPDAD